METEEKFLGPAVKCFALKVSQAITMTAETRPSGSCHCPVYDKLVSTRKHHNWPFHPLSSSLHSPYI